MDLDMSCLNKKLVLFKPSYLVARYPKSNGEFGHIGPAYSERAWWGICGVISEEGSKKQSWT